MRSELVMVGLSVILGLAGVVQPASADLSTRPRIAVRVRDTARVPPYILMRALDEVTRIIARQESRRLFLTGVRNPYHGRAMSECGRFVRDMPDAAN